MNATTNSENGLKQNIRSRRRMVASVFVGTALLGFVIACVIAAVFLLRPEKPHKYRIHLTTDNTPRRIHLAEQIRAEASRHHLEVIHAAKEYGTLDALNEIDGANDVKFSLVSGGVSAGEYPNVRMVTTLAKEPLHVLVRAELAEKGISGLRGKRVYLGHSSTASHHVGRDVLAFVGIRPTTEVGPSGYIIDPITTKGGVQLLGKIASLKESERSEAIAQLPDAAVFLAPLPSPSAMKLVKDCGYQLLPLPFAEAFALERLNKPNAEGVRIDRNLLTLGTIPAYTYNIEPPVPAKDFATISVPLLLVAREDADPEAVALLLETIHDSPLTNTIRPMPFNEQISPFPLHVGTERFLHRHDPLLTAEAASNIGKLSGGIGAFASGVIALYTFFRLRKLRRFESYFREIGRIERIARGLEVDPEAPVAADSLRTYLEMRLSILKCEVLEDFAKGGLTGEGLMAGIIALINDTRESLVRTLPPSEGHPSKPAEAAST